MKIVADENIPFVKEAFASLGQVKTMPGRVITRNELQDAELLLVRSVTRVDRSLLEGTSVRFVATATIGEDHIDRRYLQDAGIGFGSAPGSNADSVAEYVIASLLEYGETFHQRLAEQTVGIVGVGNVGSRLWKRALALGMRCVLNDPPLERYWNDASIKKDETARPIFIDALQPIEAVRSCRFLALHCPLTTDAPNPTFHLINEEFLSRLQPGAVLINTSRGGVVDTIALKKALESKQIGAAILDVWENEPDVDIELLEQAFIATPHIAGYSFDGKVNGTWQVYAAACCFLKIAPEWNPLAWLPTPECPETLVRSDASDMQREIAGAVRRVYDVRRDDEAMRTLLAVPTEKRADLFDRLRKNYPRRREFKNTRAIVIPTASHIESQLKSLGFCA